MMATNVIQTARTGKPFNGVFRITGKVAHLDEQGEPFVRLRLSCSRDLHEHLIDVEGVAITIAFLLQTSRIVWPKFVAPQADRFMAYGDASLSHQIFDVSVTQAESVVEPDRVADDIWR